MPSEVELAEVCRLGMQSGDRLVVDGVGTRLAGPWLRVSRFREVRSLIGQSLTVQTSARTLLYGGRAEEALGDLTAALRFYEQALPMVREVGDRTGEAVTRYNIAMIYRAAGRLANAVAELEQVVALDAAIQHLNLAADTQMLGQVRSELASEASAPDEGEDG